MAKPNGGAADFTTLGLRGIPRLLVDMHAQRGTPEFASLVESARAFGRRTVTAGDLERLIRSQMQGASEVQIQAYLRPLGISLQQAVEAHDYYTSRSHLIRQEFRSQFTVPITHPEQHAAREITIAGAPLTWDALSQMSFADLRTRVDRPRYFSPAIDAEIWKRVSDHGKKWFFDPRGLDTSPLPIRDYGLDMDISAYPAIHMHEAITPHIAGFMGEQFKTFHTARMAEPTPLSHAWASISSTFASLWPAQPAAAARDGDQAARLGTPGDVARTVEVTLSREEYTRLFGGEAQTTNEVLAPGSVAGFQPTSSTTKTPLERWVEEAKALRDVAPRTSEAARTADPAVMTRVAAAQEKLIAMGLYPKDKLDNGIWGRLMERGFRPLETAFDPAARNTEVTSPERLALLRSRLAYFNADLPQTKTAIKSGNISTTDALRAFFDKHKETFGRDSSTIKKIDEAAYAAVEFAYQASIAARRQGIAIGADGLSVIDTDQVAEAPHLPRPTRTAARGS